MGPLLDVNFQYTSNCREPAQKIDGKNWFITETAEQMWPLRPETKVRFRNISYVVHQMKTMYKCAISFSISLDSGHWRYVSPWANLLCVFDHICMVSGLHLMQLENATARLEFWDIEVPTIFFIMGGTPSRLHIQNNVIFSIPTSCNADSIKIFLTSWPILTSLSMNRGLHDSVAGVGFVVRYSELSIVYSLSCTRNMWSCPISWCALIHWEKEAQIRLPMCEYFFE